MSREAALRQPNPDNRKSMFPKIRTMKRIVLLAAALTAFHAATAKEYTLVSPDGGIEVTVSTFPELQWSVSRRGEPLIDASRIGLTFAGEAPLGVDPKVRSVRRTSVDTRSTAEVPTKFRELHDRCNELEIAFRGDWTLRMRAYDNGVAYRFETARRGEAVVADETAEFNFAADNDTYWTRERNPDFITHCEAFFERKRLSELDRAVYAFLPVYFATPAGTRMVVTETDLEDYPCMFLFGGEGQKLRAEFPPVVLESRLKEGSDRSEEFLRKADYIARTKGTRTYPWRVVTIDGSDRELLENYLPYQLAARPVEGDASWVRPGKIAWDWWNGLNVYGVDFVAGVNTATYKYFIDFAAKYGIEYILLDEGWSVSTLNIREPRKEVDLREIIRYGNEKGVGVVLWTLWNPMKKDLEGILDTYRAWGVKGIKIDFMQRSDQEMVNFYEQIARAAFDRHLLVDYHGAFKPAGLQRKYPNVMTFEGVYGMENDKCSADITPGHDCVLPFTRMVAGPMDYTPGATVNATAADFSISWSHPMSQGTRAHQAALYVLYESPLQMLCDSPSHYLRTPEFTSFIAAVPTVWDEIVALHAAAGEYVAVARRHGEKWYIGAITDWTGRDLEIDLSFLGEGRYRMESFEDGVNADVYAQDFRTAVRTVTRAERLSIHLASGGGWAAILTPEK